MGRIGGPAAVAEREDLPVFLQGHAQGLDKPLHRLGGNGIMRGLLGLDVLGDPLLHGPDNPPPRGDCQANCSAPTGTASSPSPASATRGPGAKASIVKRRSAPATD